MSPNPVLKTELKRTAYKKTVNAKVLSDVVVAKVADTAPVDMVPRWWGEDASDFSTIDVDATLNRQFKNVPFAAGVMNLFKKPILFKLPATRMLSAVDENKKLCLELTENEFNFLTLVSGKMKEKLIDGMMQYNAKWSEAEFSDVLKTSASSGKKYIKVKIQTRGASRTTGMDVDGTMKADTQSILGKIGSEGSFLLRLDGVYLTSTNCGLLAKVDMFRLKSVPSDEDMEEEKAARETDMREVREAELRNF